jgi:BASS family bile acid:Na+ symporter
VIIPLALVLLERTSGRHLAMSWVVIAKQMLLGILVPLAAGMTFRRFATSLADRLAGPASTMAMVVLSVCVLAIMIVSRHAVASLVGNGTILTIAVLIASGLGVGHWLGGPEQEHRTVLALATSLRHPGIAIAIAHRNFPEQKLVGAAVLLCLLVGVLAAFPYKLWARSKRGGPVVRERRV